MRPGLARFPRRAPLLASLFASAASLALAGAAQALPLGPSIAGSNSGPGGATFATTATSLTVNQSADRVVIDWNAFNIAHGETVTFNQPSPASIAFNIVTPNGGATVSPLSTISGALNANGGVWLFSTGGVIIGSTAQVNVGSFALVTAPLANGDISQLLTPDANGLTSVGTDIPTGAGVEQITIQNGAQINAASGYVALQSETINQGGAITAADGVGYAVAETGQIQFLTSPTGQQLQSAGITLVVGQDRPSFTHTGSTTAAWVGIDTPGGTMQAGYNTLINVGGTIVATGVKPDGSDDGVVMLVGLNEGPGYPGYTNSSIGVDASAASITAANGMLIDTNSAKLGAVSLGGPLDVETYGDIDVTAPVTVGNTAQLNSVAGNVSIAANFSAQQSVSASGVDISVGPGVTVQSDSLGVANGGISFSSAVDFDAAPSSLLLAGASAAAPTDNVTINAGTGGVGGDISVGAASAVNFYALTYSANNASEGAITLAGNILGTGNLDVYSNDVNTEGQASGVFTVLGTLTSGGFVDLENLGTGAVIYGPGANITSTGNQVFLNGGGDMTFEAGSQITGVSILQHAIGALTIDSGASLVTTGAPAAVTAPVLPYGAEFRRQTGLNLAAGTMTINGTVTAGAAGARDDIFIEVENLTAPATIGGNGGGSGFNLSNASFGQLTGRNVVILGGPGESTSPGVDLDVANLTLDSSKISGLWLGTASGSNILVSGAITATGSTPMDLQIGFVRQGLGGDGQGFGGNAVVNPNPGTLDGFIPGDIQITGAIGSTGAPLGSVDLIARGDILMGSSGFVAAAAANSGFNAVAQSSAYPEPANGAVLVAAQSLQLSAQGRIIQQDTTSYPYAGLSIGAPTASAPLIATQPALQGMTIGASGWTANYATGPTAIDLFGVLTPSGAAPVSDVSAARLPYLVASGVTPTAADRINSCAIGTVCVPLTAAITFVPPTVIADTIDVELGSVSTAAIVTDISVIAQVSAFAADNEDFDSERLGEDNPVTESGNRELWTPDLKRKLP